MENKYQSGQQFFHILFTQRSYLEKQKRKNKNNIKQNDLSPLWWIQKAGTYNSCHCDKTSKSCYWNKINIRCCYFKRDDRHLQSKLLADILSLLLLLPYSYYSGHSIWNHKWVKFLCHHIGCDHVGRFHLSYHLLSKILISNSPAPHGIGYYNITKTYLMVSYYSLPSALLLWMKS